MNDTQTRHPNDPPGSDRDDVPTLLIRIRSAIADRDADRARALAFRMLEEDALALLEDLTANELSRLFSFLGDESLSILLGRLDDLDAARILMRMSAAQAADILEEIGADDATDIFTEMEREDPANAETVLRAMEPDEAAEIRELMAYAPDSAGGIMTPEYVAVFPDLSAYETVEALRRVAEEAETINYVYVVSREDEALLGVLPLHRLVLSRSDALVGDLMSADVITVPVDLDQEEAARIVTDLDLMALPVVDRDNKLLGIITADDVADILEEEATEDIERLGGSQPLAVPYLHASPFLLFRKRIVWLLVLFAAQFFTVTIQENYSDILEQVILLSAFIPILIGTGGNVGSQTVSTIIRAMAVGEVRPHHVMRVVGKEAITGLALGLVMGALMFLRADFATGGTMQIALTVGFTVLILTTWAATIGAIIPIVLSKLRVDPAVVSAPFISSFVDGTGLIIYFTLAGYFLNL
ncbi:MAG: magnesium transporter [Chloroflexota bacterium]|jgi:magnesium transporter|nr:magnesium transporter [Chloroflexota bacterium]